LEWKGKGKGKGKGTGMERLEWLVAGGHQSPPKKKGLSIFSGFWPIRPEAKMKTFSSGAQAK
jgi:hypothetical protein